MGNPPDPPNYADVQANATNVANNQQGLNLQSWLSSLINQEGPWGSVGYEQTGTGPNGTPIMTAKTKYAPGIQGLFDTLVNTKATAGGQAGALLNKANYGADAPEDVIGDLQSGITGNVMQHYKASLDPFFTTARDQLHTTLSNRGLAPGNPAYDNAMRQLETSQGLTVNNLIGQTGTKAYELASGMYKMPAELAMIMGQFGSPASATQDFATGTPAVQPANLIGATANASTAMNDIWKAETQKYGDLWGGVGNIGGKLLGGWAQSPSGGAALTSLFALSDERFKVEIESTGDVINGIPLYSFRFPWEAGRRLGMMAQEVERIMPDAVIEVRGVKFVDYGKTLRQGAPAGQRGSYPRHGGSTPPPATNLS